MSNKSRRRVKMAAGALFAGAAIPIAAAGAAWADDTAAPTDPTTQTYGQLRHDGLTPAEAKAVVAAEGNGTPVEVSANGTLVVDDNNGGEAGNATATSETGHNVAAAIGGGSSASDSTSGDSHDRAFATTGGPTGTAATATIDYASHSSASATNDATATINVNEASLTPNGVTGIESTRDTATASGPNSLADIELSNLSRATSDGANSFAIVDESTHSTANSSGGSNDDSAAIGSTDSTAIARGTGSSSEVLDTDHSRSLATNSDNAFVAYADHSSAIGNLNEGYPGFAWVSGVDNTHVVDMQIGPNPF